MFCFCLMKCVILVLLMIGFVAAVDVELNCPDDIFKDEEFECSVEVSGGEGVYDVKIDLDGERDSVLEMYNDGVWKSGYYYLIDVARGDDKVDVRLRVSEEGEYDGELKLRDENGDREFFEIELEVSQPLVVEDSDSGNLDGSQMGTEDGSLLRNGSLEGGVILLGEVESISLNGGIDEVDELVYVSKDAKVVNLLPYGFSLFLVCVIGLLLWERF